MENIIEQSFNINLNIMRALGLYRPEKTKSFNKVRAYFVYIFFIILIPFSTLLSFPLGEKLDVTQINFNAAFLAESLCFIMKLLPFIRKERKIRKCIQYFGDHSFTPSSKEQKIIIDDCIRVCRRNSIVLVFSVTFAAACWVIRPLLMPDHALPLEVWLPFDIKADLKIYYFVYIYLVIGILCIGYAGIMLDPLIGGLACHGASQFIILQYTLQNLSHLAEKEETSESNNLTKAIYMSQWYEYDVKSRKALIILMESSQKPVIVTAGKILDVSLETFGIVLKRSYSLLALLRNYQ
ncbi:7tm 6 domain containing protein [Asbolus verrucosus]|uniref:7tm 6 domain containing protein n=1 Tax=Asbolus verrucosus TaxID=1661398 RepID=A0A482VBG9_ASBVE|nr:7tm 6 domain containing protein [Asbolus verrucosus]